MLKMYNFYDWVIPLCGVKCGANVECSGGYLEWVVDQCMG